MRHWPITPVRSRRRGAVGLALALILPCLPLRAEAPAPPAPAGSRLTAAELNQAVDNVIRSPEYAWRMPRNGPAVEETPDGVFTRFLADIGGAVTRGLRWAAKRLEKLIDWLRERMTRDEHAPAGPLNWETPVQALLFVLLAVTTSVLAIFLLRLWLRRKRTPTLTATALAPSPDLLHDEVAADALPSDEWMRLAQAMLQRGDMRLALRAMFLSGLAHLAEAGLIGIALSKSNREYTREVERRGHDIGGLLPAFAANVRIIERIWYGLHTPTQSMVTDFQTNHTRITASQTPLANVAMTHEALHEE